MSKFIISTDSSSDFLIGFLETNKIYCLPMKYILDGKETSVLYESTDAMDEFYEMLKRGKIPTTTQVNCYEYEEYFQKILDKEKTGDIIHVPLSSGLSGSCDNAKAAAEKFNKTLGGRKIHVVDSLLASIGIMQLVDNLIEMRDGGVTPEEAIARIVKIRDHQQTFVIVEDLFHLKRGGRIGGVKAAIGTLLKMKPIIVVNKSGRLVVENTIKGSRKSVEYVMKKIDEFGAKINPHFQNCTVYLLRSSKNETYDCLRQRIAEEYPDITIKENVLGPVVGTHVGCGASVVLFEGAERLDI